MKKYEYVAIKELKKSLESIKKYIDLKINLESYKQDITSIINDSNKLASSDGIKKYIDGKIIDFKSKEKKDIHIIDIDLHEYAKRNINDYTNITKINDNKLWNTDSNIRYRALPNASSAFNGMKNLKELKINVDTSNITNMNWMFYDCSSLTNLDLSKWNTENVENMYGMFEYCSSLISLDVSKWDTENVTNMEWMFEKCSSLTSLDVSKWNTENINSMYGIFFGCSSLTSLDVSKWDTKNIAIMGDMVSGCSNLTSLDLSNFDTKNVTSMHSMFENCSKLTSLDISNFDTKNVTGMTDMFRDCSSLTYIILEDISDNNKKLLDKIVELHNKYNKVKLLTTKENYDKYKSTYSFLDDMNNYKINRHDGMVDVDAKPSVKIIDIDLHNLYKKIDNFRAVTELPKDIKDKLYNTDPNIIYRALPDASVAFGDFDSSNSMENLKELKINVDMSNVTSMFSMFYGCSSLTSLDLSKWDTKNVTIMYCMFISCSKLTSLDVSKFDTKNVTVMSGMFGDCSSLTSLDLSNFDTKNVTDMTGMFFDCSSLTSLDLSNFDTKNVNNMTDMFENCSSLTYIILEDISDNNKKLLDQIIELHSEYNKVKLLTTKENYDTYKSTYSFLDDMNNYKINRHNGQVEVKIPVKTIDIDLHEFYKKIDNYENITELPKDIRDKLYNTDPNIIYRALPDASVAFGDFLNRNSMENLKELKINVDMSNVTSMFSMFYGCSSLTSLDLSKWDTKNVIYMDNMFYGCSKLTSLDVSKWKIMSVTSMLHMFNDCSSLTYIILEDVSYNKNLLQVISYLSDIYNKAKVLTTKENYDEYKYEYKFLDDMNNYNISRHDGQVDITHK